MVEENKPKNEETPVLTLQVANEYLERARQLSGTEDTGARRELRMELQHKYGVTEIEAINILNGMHIKQYLDKYSRPEKYAIGNKSDKDKAKGKKKAKESENGEVVDVNERSVQSTMQDYIDRLMMADDSL
ncbi:hypothetical protein SAMN02910413_1186 [Pseudobutyrivibrio sp. C4]|nr:hypothetical protein SAMN02910413_1186 [Pseudobutyrivibrio sp. C4]